VYESITLIAGSTECEAKSPLTASSIVDLYRVLIEAAKFKTKVFTVSGMPPHLTSDETQDKIDAVTLQLKPRTRLLPNSNCKSMTRLKVSAEIKMLRDVHR
jgi:hypothetical protein